MYEKFLEAILPSQGNYCLCSMSEPSRMRQRFAENASLEELYKLIEKAKKEAHTNVWFALSSFETAYSRAADDSLYIKSFFLDIDVGKEKNSYATRDEAQDAVISWVEKMGCLS